MKRTGRGGRRPATRVGLLGGAAAALLLLSAPAGATIVSGQVTTTTGTGIANVDLDFVDRASGTSIPLVNDNTDVLGFYAVDVPAGTYDIQFEPQPGDRYVAVELGSRTVSGASMVVDQQLESGWFVRARVIDELGLPIPSVDLNAVTDPGGAVQFTPRDNTDAMGLVTLVLPPGLYRIDFRPPATADLFPRSLDGVMVDRDLDLGDVVLLPGFELTGRVVGEDGPPVEGARIVFVDPVPRTTILDPNEKTDPLGRFALLVAPGSHSIRIGPPQGSRYRPRIVAGIAVAADRALPDIVLDAGVLADGFVQDELGNPVEGVDLDFNDPRSSLKAYTPKDNTDIAGFYAVSVPPGTYDIGFDPPAGSGLASVELAGVRLDMDTRLPLVQLPAGHRVMGSVQDASGTPLEGVDLDALLQPAGLEVPTPGDDTDAAGGFSVMLATGTYDFEFTPPALSGSGQATRAGVAVSAPTSLGVIVLPASGTAQPSAVLPDTGPGGGGTSVTVSGAGFAPGARVRLGGRGLASRVVLGPATISGLTRAHRPGPVDLEVENPGAEPVLLPDAYTYEPDGTEPLVFASRVGPVRTDVLLEWADTGRPWYQVYRSADVRLFGDRDLLETVVGGRHRDDGGVVVPGLVFYTVD